MNLLRVRSHSYSVAQLVPLRLQERNTS
eukprot:COSAG02_NODE_50288_length_321_cov_1.009009_2_plen_27_part_01